MKVKYLQILGAFSIGLLVPVLILQAFGMMKAENPEHTIGTTGTQPTMPPQQTRTIPVLHNGGETVSMELEEYLVGVILAEMPTSFDAAALEAQAVVARTYAMKRYQEMRHPDSAVCTDSACCQSFIAIADYLNGLGYPEDVEIAKDAVLATSGMVLTYEDELAEATYFHSSGGRTEDAVAVWGTVYPYLQATESPGEEQMKHFTAQVFYDKPTLELLLGIHLSDSPKSWLGWTTYTAGGGVDTMIFGGREYTGVQLRKLLNLNSTAFTMEPEEDGVLITTLGKGHRVGMSQCGAQAMALEGATCLQILRHYYPGTRIDKIEDVG